jgi:hypothetical protein
MHSGIPNEKTNTRIANIDTYNEFCFPSEDVIGGLKIYNKATTIRVNNKHNNA